MSVALVLVIISKCVSQYQQSKTLSFLEYWLTFWHPVLWSARGAIGGVLIYGTMEDCAMPKSWLFMGQGCPEHSSKWWFNWILISSFLQNPILANSSTSIHRLFLELNWPLIEGSFYSGANLKYHKMTNAFRIIIPLLKLTIIASWGINQNSFRG